MFSRSYTRLVWKEYRAQRSLWIALLAGAVLIESCVLFFSSEAQRAMPAYPLYVAAVLSVCYAICSGAMLFAREREEETDRLLQAIAVQPRILTLAKLSWMVLSLLLFSLLAFTGSFAVIGMLQNTRRSWSGEDPGHLFWVYLQAIPTGLAAALLVSLLTRRVISALMGGVLLLLLCSAVSYNLFESESQMINAACAVVMLVGELMLIPAWLQGGLDWSRWAGTMERLPLRVRRSLLFPRVLQRSAMRATSASRQFGVLVWRELRAAVPVVLISLILTSGWIPALLNPRIATGPTDGWLGTWVFFSVVGSWFLLGAMGLLAFSGDQRQRVMQFYADRGASPWLIWLAKQLVWISTLMIPGILTGCLMLFLRMSWRIDSSRHGLLPEQVWQQDRALSLSCLLTMYAVVQCLGMWFRQTLVAGALAFVACCLIVPAHYVLGTFEIPLWFSSGPIIVAGLAASYFTLEGWLKETRSWRCVGTQLAWAILPVLLAGASVFVWRIVEIPWVDPGYDWQAHERKMAHFDPEWTSEWEQLFYQATLPQAERAELQPSYLERAARIADRIESGLAPQIDPQFLLRSYSLRQTYDILFREDIESHVGTKATGLEEQWQALWACQTLNTYVTTQTPTSDTYAIHLMDGIQLAPWWLAWAQDERQTPQLLDRLITSPHQLPFFNWKNDDVTRRQAYMGRGWGREWAKYSSPSLYQLVDTFPLSLLVEERARLIRLLNWKALLKTTVNQRPVSAAQQIRDWDRTTPFDTNSQEWLQQSIDGAFRKELEQQWVIRIIARLEKYRIQHGHYPERLYDLGDEASRMEFGIRPGEFRYEPHGLDRPLVVAGDCVLPAGQPVLFRDTDLRTEFPHLLTDQERADFLKTPSGPAILKLLDSGGVYWGNHWNQYHPYGGGRQYGSFPEVLHTLENIPEKTDRVKYVRFGEGEPAALTKRK